MFSTASGEVASTDFTPVGRQLGAGVNDYVRLNSPAWIVRCVECLRGAVDMATADRPSRAFARDRVSLVAESGVVDAGAEMPRLFGGLDYQLEDDVATASWSMTTGDCPGKYMPQRPLAARAGEQLLDNGPERGGIPALPLAPSIGGCAGCARDVS